MKRTGFITLICLAFGLIVNGQNKSITKTDLYGTWILVLKENNHEDDGFIFVKKKEPETLKADMYITISLLELDECLVNYDNAHAYCGNGAFSTDYSWTFDKGLEIVNIYKSEKWLKEFKEKYPDEFKKFNMPDKYDEMELSLVVLENKNIGLEIINWE